VDHQVKLRGFRIELGEIEAVLARRPAVQEAVVVVKEYGPGDQRLVAYVVGAESLASGELRQYLKGVLPEYMVPQVLVQLERLPLTANGKVDRRALAALEHVREETEQIVAAQTPVEEMLVGIWSEVLGVPVGVADDFFELGGHSLLATQAISQIRQVFGVELPLRALFEAPTVASLGERVGPEHRAGVAAGSRSGSAADRAARASGRGAAVICAAAFMVHRSIRTRSIDVQRAAGAAAEWTTERERAGAELH
jgi:acyl carrier protein